MLRYALPRFYFAMIGLLLLTLPLFASARIDFVRSFPLCTYPPTAVSMHLRCLQNDATVPDIPRGGVLYAAWQTGTPPNDYWPLALMLLAAGGAIEAGVLLRSRIHAT